MSRIFIALALSLVLFACSKNGKEDTKVPASIQQLIDGNTSCVCDPYIKLYTWRGELVYLRYMSGPLCNGVPVYYNEEGEEITMEAGYTLDQFLAEGQFVKTVWQCSGQ